jgi:hypothetical protein
MTQTLKVRKLALYTLLALVGIGIAAAICYASFRLLFITDPPLSDVEEEIGIDLPDSAANVQYSHAQFLGVSAYLRFTLARDDLPNLLSQICVGGEVLEAGYVSRYVSDEASANPDWWTPDIDAMSAFSGGDCRFIEDRLHTYSILVDESDTEMLEVYLYASIENIPD